MMRRVVAGLVLVSSLLTTGCFCHRMCCRRPWRGCCAEPCCVAPCCSTPCCASPC